MLTILRQDIETTLDQQCGVEDDQPEAQREHVVAGTDFEELSNPMLREKRMLRQHTGLSCGGWAGLGHDGGATLPGHGICAEITAAKFTYQANALIAVYGSLWGGWSHWMRVPSWTQVGTWLHEPWSLVTGRASHAFCFFRCLQAFGCDGAKSGLWRRAAALPHPTPRSRCVKGCGGVLSYGNTLISP